MYIKTLVIQGFKSYKDQTVMEPFSQHHNVVAHLLHIAPYHSAAGPIVLTRLLFRILVGRNGSGKSNFFWAIRFVLGDAYSNMTREERQSLLHEGQGSVISAFVEILFDNEDNRFPTGKDQVVLRRSIGLKKDEYSLDRKTVTKSEVLNLLESAGFSRSNPYYIVPQGRITALTNAKDSERLTLLKEVAGTKVYEQKRIESLKIMDETLGKRDQIDELLEYIEERLEELDAEKEELTEYLAADKDRRCLEYAIYFRDQNDAIETLEQLEDDRQHGQTEIVELYKRIADRQLSIQEEERELLKEKSVLAQLLVEQEQVKEDISTTLQSKSALALELGDLESGLTDAQSNRKRLLKEKAALVSQIKERQGKLTAMAPEFAKIQAQEAAAKEKFDELDAELKRLTAKQGNHQRFKNALERDAWTKGKITTMQEALQETTNQLAEATAARAKTSKEAADLRGEIEELKSRVTGRRALLEVVEKEYLQVKQQKEELELERKNLWREANRLQSTFDDLKKENDKNIRAITKTMDKNTAKGLKSVEAIVQRLGLPGYFGPLYDLFTVDESFQTAVEVIAGASLFHLVVDTDQTASTILDVLNREKGGRVTFMPLNRLRPKESRYPDSDNAVPLLSRLEFDEKFRPAMTQVFGKAILAPTLDEAAAFAKSHQLTGITFEGDRADRKGALTGGFLDFNQSRLDAITAMRSSRERMQEDQKIISDNEARVQQIEQDLLILRDKLNEAESKKRSILSGRDPIVSEINFKTQTLEQYEGFLIQEGKNMERMEESIREYRSQIDISQKELGTPFRKRLEAAELSRLEALPDLVQNASSVQSELIKSRTKLEAKKNQIEISINSNLSRSLADLENQLSTLEEEGGTNDSSLNSHRAQLKTLEVALDASNGRLRDIEVDVDELQATLAGLKKRIDKSQAEMELDQAIVERKQRAMDKYLARKSVLVQKKETALGHIRDLGVLPDEAFEKYRETDGKIVLQKLHKVNETIKKFSHVNKKAFEQYTNFTKQREQLQDRKEELDTSAKSIEKLINTLDQRKNEAIDKTFEQVALFFKEVWGRLVPEGDGEMMMVRRSEDMQVETQSQLVDTGAASDYIGVSLNVSFQPGQKLRMGQLSGGQKSLVALALIFAIQKCDPAPFYLFDEIDAALDTQYRTSVADMVKELSKNAQFITTTFRPELLVNADKFYGVTFANKVSKIQSITRQDAQQFVESQATV